MVLWLLQGEYVWNIGWEKKLETERAAVLRKAQQQKEDEEKAAQRGGALRLSNLSVLEEDDLDDVDMLQAHKRVVLRRVRELKASGLPPSTPSPSISASSSS